MTARPGSTWLGGVFLLALLAGGPALPPARAEDPPTPPQRKELEEQAARLNAEGMAEAERGATRDALPKLEQALSLLQRLHPGEDHRDVAGTHVNLGRVREALGDSEQARAHFEAAEKMHRRLARGRDHPDLANALGYLGLALAGAGDGEAAVRQAEAGLKMHQRLARGADHADVAGGLARLGAVHQLLGRSEAARPCYEDALAMLQRLHRDRAHPKLVVARADVGEILAELGRFDQARPHFEAALELARQLYGDQAHVERARSRSGLGRVLTELGRADEALPHFEAALKEARGLCGGQDHPNLAIALNNYGDALRQVGRSEQALPQVSAAVKMLQRLYPDRDDAALANGLIHLSALLIDLGQAEKAGPLAEAGLKMCRALYPDQDHPHTALALGGLGSALLAQDRTLEALPHLRAALEMNRRLHQGRHHPDVANNLANLGRSLANVYRDDEALPYFEEALKVNRALYRGQDHPYLASNHDDLALSLDELGRPGAALASWEEVFQVNARVLRREAAFAPEAQALERLRELPAPRDSYLRLTRQQGTDAGRAAGHLWTARALVTRVLERRHFAAHESDEIRRGREQLAQLRARLTGALVRPLDDPLRDGLLRELTLAKEKAERDLLRLLPARARPAEPATPADLAAVLPADAVYLDLVRYQDQRVMRIDQEVFKRPEARYTAFVHGPKAPPVRLDLGTAREIDEAANAWRQTVLAWPAAPARGRAELAQQAERHAAVLRTLVWDRLAPALPRGTATIYLSVEGDLGRFPFAALPGDKPGTVLLERFAFVHVPHGPALVERLRAPAGPDDGKGSLLVVGGVDYGAAPAGRAAAWRALPGAARERRQLEQLAGDRARPVLGDSDATAGRVLAELPRAAYAHLGTHGRFDADLFAADLQRAAEFRQRLATFQPGGALPDRAGLGARSPLGYVGLVLAGANDPDKAGPDGGVLSGEALAGLQLEGLRLVVLSACETGLGANTDTEGVRGLQRAFHIAGCPDVVASLWEVGDEATAALMNAFWERVLVAKQRPEQALREAQLLVYRRPDLVPTLATRGPGFGKVVKVNPDEEPEPPAPAGGPRRSHPHLWAAFFLSGSGR